MSDLGPLHYLAILAGTTALSLGLTPLALRVAVRNGILDHPVRHKTHATPVPYLGGVAIVVAFSVAVVVAALLRPPSSALDELVAILGLAVLLALVGLADDLRGLGAGVRLAAQLAAALVLWWVGVRVSLFHIDALDLAVTVVWVVGVTNAFNLLDNMDGLSAGVAGIGALSFFTIAALNGQFLVAALSMALVGCALGFLWHNFHPARIYMGDAGALFLGFVLAALGIKLRFAGPIQVTFLVPILVLGVAIFDTTLVSYARLRHGRNPLAGGRDHVSHRLVRVGLPVPAAVGLIYAAAAACGWLAVIVSRLDRPTAYLLVGLVVAIAALLGALLAAVPVYGAAPRRIVLPDTEEHDAPVS